MTVVGTLVFVTAVLEVALVGRYLWNWNDSLFAVDRVADANRYRNIGTENRMRLYGALWIAGLTLNTLVWPLVFFRLIDFAGNLILSIEAQGLVVGFFGSGLVLIAMIYQGRPKRLFPPQWRQALNDLEQPQE